MSEIQLSEQEKKEYDAVFNEWMEKIAEIPPYEERNPGKGKGSRLDGGYNGIYTELERIYRPKLDKILGRDDKIEKSVPLKSQRKKFSDILTTNPNGFPELPKRK